MDTNTVSPVDIHIASPSEGLYVNVTEGEGTTPGGYRDSWADIAVKNMWLHVAPIILVIGLIGNALVFLVVKRKSLQGTTTSVYLQLTAVADNATLIFSLLPDLLEETDVVTIKNIHAATCKIQKFLQYISLDIAVWLLAAFAFDRFIAVCFPFHKQFICRPKKAKAIATILFIAALAKNVHVFWTRGPEVRLNSNSNSTYIKVCGKPTPEFAYFSNFIRPWIVFAVASVLPTCFLLVCNLWIIIDLELRRSTKEMKSKRHAKHRQMAAMCLGVSFVFIVCTIPSIVILIGRPWWSKSSPESYTIAKGINNLLLFVNHSFNVITFSVTGEKFREETRAVLCCKRDVRYRSSLRSDITSFKGLYDSIIGKDENISLTTKQQNKN